MDHGITAPTREDILATRDRISGYVRETPVLRPGRGAFGVDADLTLKLELLQHTGSFKPRGAFSKLLASAPTSAGVVAASGGNFGLAVAYAARTLGHRAEIFVPSTSPASKIERVRDQGAVVTVVDGYYDDAATAAAARQRETGALAMHPYDQPEVVAGQGTIGIEVAAQVPQAETILVACGGGGLVAGIAAWFRGEVRVVGVEPEGSCCLHAAMAAGTPVDVPVRSVAADSLGTARAGTIATEVAQAFVDRVVLVSDDAIVATQRTIWQELRLIAEPGGAAAMAALRSGAYVPHPSERVVVLLCGANCDPATVTG
jgi:threonine dehydratase